MSLQEIIKQLTDLIYDRKSFLTGDKEHDAVFLSDIEALEITLRVFETTKIACGSKTKADVIKEMSIEQLAAFIESIEMGELDNVTYCLECAEKSSYPNCDGRCVEHWLNSSADDINGLFKLNRI